MSTALVLGGGGVTGIAWELGVLFGLEESGVDLVAMSDVVVGTSAGSTVGAQVLSGTPLSELFNRQIAAQYGEISPTFDVERLMAMFALVPDGGTRSDDERIRIGALALDTSTVPESVRRNVIETRLPSHKWPSKSFTTTAINARTGEFVVFDANSGVSIVDAVAASCAVPCVWPPVTIGTERFYDGGLRTTTNAHLVTGSSHVVIVAPQTTGVSRMVHEEIHELESAGSHVVMIHTDADAIAAMGINSLDPTFRAPSAEHGRRQGRAAAGLFEHLR